MRPSICYVGFYDSDYPRNQLTVRAFQEAGARVEFVGRQGVAGAASFPLGPTAPALMKAARQAVKRLLTAGDVAIRMIRCRMLVVGYVGQFELLLYAPIAKLFGRPVVFNPLVTLTDTLVEDRQLVASAGVPARLIEAVDFAALKLADVVLTDTHANAEFLSSRFSLDRSRIVVLPVGADESIFFQCEPDYEPDDDRLDVLFYGKFIPLHGIETIVRAVRIIERRGESIRVELVGTGQEYDAMRRLAGELGVGGIHWTDWLPYDALGARLRRADVALGVFSGGTKAARVIPNKVHQALACGVPVVTRRSPAALELLKDRESALLVPPDDPEALARALVELRDPALRKRLGSCGRETWERQASSARQAAILTEVLSRAGLDI